MDLKDRAVLVKFTDRCWIGGTVDAAATKQVEDANSAVAGTGQYWKRLIPRAALKERVNIGGDARGFHDNQTLPWLGGGVRILPASNFNEYMAGMRKRQIAAQAAVKEFLASYDMWVAEAKRTQGTLFNPAHYPTKEQVVAKFGFDLDVLPLPNIADWRVDLSAEQAEEVRKQAEAKFAELQNRGVKELFERLRETLEHAKERLDDPEKTFRDSLIGNIKSMVELAGRLNYTNDPALEKIRVEVAESFKDVGPEELRTNPVARAKAAKSAGSIISKMAAFMGGGALPVPSKPDTKKQAVEGASEESVKDRKNRMARERRANKKGNGAAQAGT